MPKTRVQDSSPLTVSRVDFAGPLQVRSSTVSGQKTYIFLFTCAVTTVVYLEIVTPLSRHSEDLIVAIISGNATTFKAAATYLKRLTKSKEVADTLSNKSITWQFITERAPWFGRFWEHNRTYVRNTEEDTRQRMRIHENHSDCNRKGRGSEDPMEINLNMSGIHHDSHRETAHIRGHQQ